MDIQTKRKIIAERKQASFEAYERFEYLRILRDEHTDQAERLAAPMAHSFEYKLRDGELYSDYDEKVSDILSKGLDIARTQAVISPAWRFEVARREIELEEWGQVEAFARGDIEAEGLVVMSPIPDVVKNNPSIQVNGYNRERQKMLARIITRTNGGIKITSMSLDKSDYQAMQGIATNLGYDLPDGLGSEEVLAKRFWIDTPVDSHEELASVVRESYDRVLTRKYGGDWYAGRRPIDLKSALEFIENQHDLTEQHMQAVMSVKKSIADVGTQNIKLDELRYNYAAALDKRINNQVVTTLAAAGAEARSEGKSFDGDCPTSINNQNTTNQLEAMGYRGKVWGNCPCCREFVNYDPCDPVCSNKKCSSNGYRPEPSKFSKPKKAADNKMNVRRPKVKRNVEQKSGIITKEVIVIGGTKKIFIDQKTGQQIN